MRIFLNSLGASCSSGLTYLRNVVPHLSAQVGVQTTLAVGAEFREEFEGYRNVCVLTRRFARNAGFRFCQEQTVLPRLVRDSGANVVISAGNFAMRHSPVPQILLSGNSIYTSQDFFRDLNARREHRLWMETKVRGSFARRSAGWADSTIAPSRWFASEIRRWTGKSAVSIHHGFDPAEFFADRTPLPAEIREKLDVRQDSFRLLFVSHYNYYRNFETLLRALPVVRERLRGRRLRLFLTCELQTGRNPGSYRPESAAALVKELGISEEVVGLGTIPYRLLHQVYKACDVYVTPAYTETFAHPVVEAMASSLPVVASDIPVHREICESAALYFQRFSPDELAEQIVRLAGSPQLWAEFAERGRVRSCDFSWAKHVSELLMLAENLVRDDECRLPQQKLVA
jgi:glycosyltransferase involved in cell wall biosynthesis